MKSQPGRIVPSGLAIGIGPLDPDMEQVLSLMDPSWGGVVVRSEHEGYFSAMRTSVKAAMYCSRAFDAVSRWSGVIDWICGASCARSAAVCGGRGKLRRTKTSSPSINTSGLMYA